MIFKKGQDVKITDINLKAYNTIGVITTINGVNSGVTIYTIEVAPNKYTYCTANEIESYKKPEIAYEEGYLGGFTDGHDRATREYEMKVNDIETNGANKRLRKELEAEKTISFRYLKKLGELEGEASKQQGRIAFYEDLLYTYKKSNILLRRRINKRIIRPKIKLHKVVR